MTDAQQTTPAQELRPCHMPDCKGEPKYISREWGHRIICSICIYETGWLKTEQEARDAWNYRPVEDALKREIDRLTQENEALKTQLEASHKRESEMELAEAVSQLAESRAWEDVPDNSRVMPDDIRLQRKRGANE